MIHVERLEINHLRENLGTDETLGFGWKLVAEGRNVEQSKYWIRISKMKDFSVVEWQSGEVSSPESQNVPTTFCPEPAEEYWAQVAVETTAGERSAWSEPARFVTGLGGMGWRARYITAETPACPEVSKGTCVRGTFTVDGEVRCAWMFTSALGVYTPWMNGQRVGSDLLAPGWTSYHKHALYQTNDVTALLRQGENAVGGMLAAGWYKGLMGFLGLRNNYGKRTAFLCQIVIRYADGRCQIEGSGPDWMGSDSPVIFAEIYDGERYDARLERSDWCLPGASSTGWRAVEIVRGDMDVLTAQPGCRVRCEQVLPAIGLFTTPEGDRVVDFGQNLTGWPAFAVRGRTGMTCGLRCFETLDAQGNVYTANLRSAKQELWYTCASDSEVEFHPEFTYYGFRYLQLLSWPEDAKAEDFSAWVVHSDLQPVGEFECSEPLVNQLHHNILWGMKGNFLDVPTDCPQRNERMGWTGDAQIFCQTAACLMDVYPFYRKWLVDVRSDQTPEGGVPHVVPDIITGREKVQDDWLLSQGTHSAAGWADAIVICTWTLYVNYGDRQILEENYVAMRAWIEFMRVHSVGNIWNYRLQFGDWVALDAAEGSYFGATPNDLTCTAYYAYSTALFARIARILGREDDAETYGRLYDEIVRDFRKVFFTPAGDMTVQTQTAHILALRFNLAPPEHRSRTAQALVRLLARENGHLVTGFMGTTFFPQVLAENGFVDEAYDLLLKEDFPSWLYQVKQGATTVWEHWDGMRPDGTMWSPDMNSFNHYAYGAVGEWLYGGVLGLRADANAPGYRHAILRPRMSRKMRFARGAIDTTCGRLALSWAWEDDGVRICTEVPANARATLELDGLYCAEKTDGVVFVHGEQGLYAELGSGSYEFFCR